VKSGEEGDEMNEMIVGAIAMAFAIAGLFFFRFWRKTGNRLFALFALRIFVSAANRIAIVVANQQGDQGDYFYWVRFLAFAIILAAIIDKNRTVAPHPRSTS
jgi:hypothetical protein